MSSQSMTLTNVTTTSPMMEANQKYLRLTYEPRDEVLRIPGTKRKHHPVPLQPLRQPPAPTTINDQVRHELDIAKDTLCVPQTDTRCSTMRSDNSFGILDFYLNSHSDHSRPVSSEGAQPMDSAIAGFDFGLPQKGDLQIEEDITDLVFEPAELDSIDCRDACNDRTSTEHKKSPQPPSIPVTTPAYSLFPTPRLPALDIPATSGAELIPSSPISATHSRTDSGASSQMTASTPFISPLPSNPYKKSPQKPRGARLRSATITTIESLSSPSASSTSTIRPSTSSMSTQARSSGQMSIRWSGDTMSRPLLSPTSRTAWETSTFPRRSSRPARGQNPFLEQYSDVPIKSAFDDDDSDVDRRTSRGSSGRWSGWTRKLSWSASRVREIDESEMCFGSSIGGSDNTRPSRRRALTLGLCGCGR